MFGTLWFDLESYRRVSHYNTVTTTPLTFRMRGFSHLLPVRTGQGLFMFMTHRATFTTNNWSTYLEANKRKGTDVGGITMGFPSTLETRSFRVILVDVVHSPYA